MSDTLKCMAREYRANAEKLLGRIKELKAMLAQTDRKTADYARLMGRIRMYESIYTENMSTAVYLENYHEEH